MQEMRVQFLGQENPLEQEMATYSSILAWKILWTEMSDGPQCIRSNKELDTSKHKHKHNPTSTSTLPRSWGLHPHDLIISQRPPSPNTITPGFLVLHKNLAETQRSLFFSLTVSNSTVPIVTCPWLERLLISAGTDSLSPIKQHLHHTELYVMATWRR